MALIFVPLDVTSRNGHSDIVRELIYQFGIEGCVGEGGHNALGLAATDQRLETMAVLMDAGVVDTGTVLLLVVRRGYEGVVK